MLTTLALILGQQPQEQIPPEQALGMAVCGLFCGLVLVVPVIAGMWKTFAKAGKPGWASIIPIYHHVVVLQMINRPMWWLALIYVPCLNFVTLFIARWVLSMGLAKVFGKGFGFGLGLFLLPIVFVPMLGFGSAVYQSPEGGAGGAAVPRPAQPGGPKPPPRPAGPGGQRPPGPGGQRPPGPGPQRPPGPAPRR